MSRLTRNMWRRWSWRGETRRGFSSAATQLSTNYSKSAGEMERDFFFFFFYPFWQLWVLLLESFWQIQRYLTTTSSSLFRHGCSSCWGDVLSGDDIIINYLRGFFSVILWELLISLKDEKNCRGVSGYLTLYFSSSTLLEVEILSEVHCILQPVPLSILVLDCGEQIRLCEIMEKYIKRTHSMLCFLVSLTWHSSLKRT